MASDPVHAPAHYLQGRQYEPRKVIQDWGLCWELGNALKYIARAGRKGDEAEDLRKAIEYIQYRLEVITPVGAVWCPECEANPVAPNSGVCGACR